PGGALLVEPAQLCLTQQENPAHDQGVYVFGMGLRVGQRQGRTPGAAEHHHLVRVQDLGAQALDVGDQIPGGVVFDVGRGGGPAAAALVEQQHVVACRIEQAAVGGRTACAGPAVQEYRRAALG